MLDNYLTDIMNLAQKIIRTKISNGITLCYSTRYKGLSKIRYLPFDGLK